MFLIKNLDSLLIKILKYQFYKFQSTGLKEIQQFVFLIAARLQPCGKILNWQNCSST